MLALDLLGSSTCATGLTCTATSPASLNVQIGPGRLYSLQNVDGTAYSSLAADTTHTILKQGMLADPLALGCAAPSTFGFSINYLIQAAYQDLDTDLITLPYYNATNPSQPFSGAGNTGTAQATTRAGVIALQAKAGIAATTGTQTTPAPDAGFVGLYAVTVANGQTTITAANISTVATAPFINGTFPVVCSGPFAAPATINVNYTKIAKTVTLFFPGIAAPASGTATNLLSASAGTIPSSLIPASALATFASNPTAAFWASVGVTFFGTGVGTAGIPVNETSHAGIDSAGALQIVKPTNWATLAGSINGVSAFTMTYQTVS